MSNDSQNEIQEQMAWLIWKQWEDKGRNWSQEAGLRKQDKICYEQDKLILDNVVLWMIYFIC